MKLEDMQIGTLCALNSGSPLLTITDIDETEEMVTVEWINENGVPQQAIFPFECVKAVVL